MRILFLCDEYPPSRHGGIGSVTQLLARELVRQGHSVFVAGFYPYYRKGKIFEVDMGVKVNRFFYGNKISLKLSKHYLFGKFVNVEQKFNGYIDFIKGLISQESIELIELPDFHEVFRYTGPRAIQYPDLGIPMLVKLHGSSTFFSSLDNERIINPQVYPKEKNLLNNANGIISVSQFVKDKTRILFELNKSIEIIPNGISLQEETTYKADTFSKTVVFVGKLTKKKGIFNLVRAWNKVIKVNPEARLKIYGQGSKKDMHDLQSLIKHDSISLEGFIQHDQLAAVYSKASCAIFPSFAESFGMTPIEAMVVGCPTIFTKLTSGPEIIDHERNGFLVDPNDIDDIANAILFYLGNRAQAIEIGRLGAKTIREKFNIEKIAKQHIICYKKFIK